MEYTWIVFFVRTMKFSLFQLICLVVLVLPCCCRAEIQQQKEAGENVSVASGSSLKADSDLMI